MSVEDEKYGRNSCVTVPSPSPSLIAARNVPPVADCCSARSSLYGDSQSKDTPGQLRLAESSMDLIIDDGDHSARGNERTLLALCA